MVRFRKGSGKVQGRFKKGSGTVQERLRKGSGKVQARFESFVLSSSQELCSACFL